LGEGLPPEVDIFWTGPEICSREYPEIHMKNVIELLGRKPFLWDNYPVNDGADISRFLFLKAFENRPHILRDLTSGHAVNPMNQPWLSRIPLYSLPRSYARGASYDPAQALDEALRKLCAMSGSGERNLAKQIASDVENFHTLGLDRLDQGKRHQLIDTYSHFDTPYSKEIIDWLNEEYAFDPDCLTG
jgi:hypothetical protein